MRFREENWLKKYISPHGVNMYLTCPRMFYFYYNDYVPLSPPVYLREILRFGETIHRVISNYYRLISTANVVNEENYIEFLKKAYHSESIDFPDDYRERLKKIMNNFRNFEYWRLSSQEFFTKPLYVEYEVVNEEYRIHGIVDVVFKKKTGENVVVDWKTGLSSIVSNPNIRLQISLYCFMLNASEGYIINLDRDEFLDRVDLIPRDELIEIIETIYSDKAYLPIKGEHCRICPYQLPCVLGV